MSASGRRPGPRFNTANHVANTGERRLRRALVLLRVLIANSRRCRHRSTSLARLNRKASLGAPQPSWFRPDGKPNESEYSHAENDNRNRGHFDRGKPSCHAPVSSAVEQNGVDLDHAAFSTAGAISGAGGSPVASPALNASGRAPSSFSSGPMCHGSGDDHVQADRARQRRRQRP